MNPSAVYDIETENWTTFVCGGIFDVQSGKYEAYWYDREEEFVDRILSIKGEVYAHNGGRFDHLWLLDHAVKRKLRVKLYSSAGSIIKADFEGGLKLRDSFRIFPMSLKDLTNDGKGGGKIETGLPCRGERDECREKLAWQRINGETEKGCGGYCSIRRDMPPEHRRLIWEYMERDNLALWEALNHFSKYASDNRIVIGPTIGSTAWKTAKEELQLEGQYLGPSDFKFVRSGYYGGRCQLFKPEAATGFQYDVNSMYPAMLAQKAVPVGPAKRVCGKKARGYYGREQPGIYRASISMPHMHIPTLPVRTPKRIAYPWGSFEGVWALPELLYAEKNGAIVKPLEAVVYNAEEVIFTDWINRLFGLRARYGKKSREGAWMKWLMNSLTGKFGSNPEKEHIILNPDTLKVCKGGRNECPTKGRRDCFGCCIRHCRCNAMRPIAPRSPVYAQSQWRIDDCAHAAWAAYLTSHARITLHTMLTDGGGDDALYCDTDSCFSSNPRVNNVGPELGKWSDDGSLTDFTGWAPKVYTYKRDGKFVLKAKGVRFKEKQEQETWDMIVRGDTLKAENMAGARDSSRSGDVFFRRTTVKRQLNRGFGDRIVDGAGTRAPHISEVEGYGD